MPDIIQDIRDLRRRISELERAARNPATVTLPGGDYDVFSQLYDAQGRILIATERNTKGLMYPFDHSAFVPARSVEITGTSWTDVAVTAIYWPAQEVLRFEFDVEAPSGQGMQFRLFDGNTNFNTTKSYTGTGSAEHVVCEWLHPFEIGMGEDTAAVDSTPALRLQARLTTAITDFDYPLVQMPYGLTLVSKPVAPNAKSNSPFRVEGTALIVPKPPEEQFDHMAWSLAIAQVYFHLSSYQSIATTELYRPSQPVLRFTMKMEVQFGTTARIRLVDANDSPLCNYFTYSPASSSAADQNVTVLCEWLHGLEQSDETVVLVGSMSVNEDISDQAVCDFPKGLALVSEDYATAPSSNNPFTVL